MRFDDLLVPQRIELDFEASSKKKVLERIAHHLSSSYANVSAVTVAEGLFSRERLGSTGLGFGVALPHTRLAEVNSPTASFLRLASPVDFNTSDKESVNLIVGLAVPQDANEEHLKILAHFASLFKDSQIRSQLYKAGTVSEVQKLLLP